MLVLGIETSCDETAVALYDSHKGLLAQKIHSQLDTHRRYRGVVPELASRDHILKTLPLVQEILELTKISSSEIQGIAYTKGPGLVGALMVGATIGKSLAYAWKIPVVGVHHMECHLMAMMLEQEVPEFPFLALLVSGGHTLLVNVKKLGDYEILGESVDDAVGEAFDKIAQLLDLDYPGGAALAKLAEQGNPQRFVFPRPLMHQANFDFSFSGLKTAVVRCHQTLANIDLQTKADIACAFEEAIVDVLIHKCERALQATALNQLVLVGGVAANKKLRARLKEKLSEKQVAVFYPRLEYCTDNGAMVAYTGCLRLMAGEKDDPLSIAVKPRWSMAALQ